MPDTETTERHERILQTLSGQRGRIDRRMDELITGAREAIADGVPKADVQKATGLTDAKIKARAKAPA
jgi:hypothetical protein